MPLKMQSLILAGILLIITGLIIIFFGVLSSSKDPNAKVAVGGFIGPIPFGFGNDWQLVWIGAIISLALFLAGYFSAQEPGDNANSPLEAN